MMLVQVPVRSILELKGKLEKCGHGSRQYEHDSNSVNYNCTNNWVKHTHMLTHNKVPYLATILCQRKLAKFEFAKCKSLKQQEKVNWYQSPGVFEPHFFLSFII